tara:strand:- start:35 stop:280 length:246 start_codon:yes stop_codon:yes gene_type:complete
VPRLAFNSTGEDEDDGQEIPRLGQGDRDQRRRQHPPRRAALLSSGNMGWYLGGKIEIMVGKEKVWAQLGCNISIPGSNCWK